MKTYTFTNILPIDQRKSLTDLEVLVTSAQVIAAYHTMVDPTWHQAHTDISAVASVAHEQPEMVEQMCFAIFYRDGRLVPKESDNNAIPVESDGYADYMAQIVAGLAPGEVLQCPFCGAQGDIIHLVSLLGTSRGLGCDRCMASSHVSAFIVRGESKPTPELSLVETMRLQSRYMEHVMATMQDSIDILHTNT